MSNPVILVEDAPTIVDVQTPGVRGPVGTSVTNAAINGSGHLIFTLSDGTTLDAGVVSGGAYYTFTQNVPAATWNVTHSLGRFPSVTVVDSAGTMVQGDVQYVDANSLTLIFGGAFAGTAYLN